jgi:hypothetical protein
MSFFSKILGKKEEKDPIVSLMPQEIYEAGVLELKDVIAPSSYELRLLHDRVTSLEP